MAPDAEPIIDFALPPASSQGALEKLHPTLRAWFTARYPQPTLAQRHAWPVITQGHHLLLSAPTGSGKTLAAFLPVISELLREATRLGVRCLYVTPLRALCNDIEKGLKDCLAGVDSAGGIRLGTRTGDTSAYRRQRLWAQPPAILLITPESLALLLAHPAAPQALADVRWVIVDEVHAFTSTKRGADLAISLERLSAVTHDEPQRIGLSATCRPLAGVARWLVGMGRTGVVAAVPDERPLDIQVEYLPPAETELAGFMRTLLRRLLPILLVPAPSPLRGEGRGGGDEQVEPGRPSLIAPPTPTLPREGEGRIEQRPGSTIVFTNTRSIAERLVWCLRREHPAWAEDVAVHHSAVGASARLTIENRLKAGELRVVVTSTSLELGIDVGAVDQVVMVHPPGGSTRLLQRVGRSGHGPHRLRRGIVYAANPHELLEAVVTVEAGGAGQIEPLAALEAPLDVLCQQLVGMAVQQPWTVARAWEMVRRAYPFRHLKLDDLVDCLRYLGGETQASAKNPRLRWRDHQFRVLDRRTARLYRMNVGTITAEEARSVLLEDGSPLGTVPEGFADRLEPGDRFLLGGRCLELSAHGAAEMLVTQACGAPLFTRWHGGFWRAPQELAERVWWWRGGTRRLEDSPSGVSNVLNELLDDQEGVSEVPSSGLVLVELVEEGDGLLCSVHLPLAAPGAEAVARVVRQRLGRDRCRVRAAGMLGFTLSIAGQESVTPERLRELLGVEGFAADLERSLVASSLLAERFRITATTGLMLLRQPIGRRRRVGGRGWAGRRLLNWLRFAEPRFPLLRQAIADTLHDALQVEHAVRCLARMAEVPIVMRRLPHLSPFAEAWEEQARVQGQESGGGLTALMAGAACRLVHDEWLLTPQRAAVHRPSRSAVIADVHLGYDATRQAGGEAIPSLGWRSFRERVMMLQARFGIQRVLVAGDLVETPRQTDMLHDIAGWLASRRLDFWLVPGNHDRGLGEVEGLQVFPGGVKLGRWLILHEPDLNRATPQVIGHVHPSVRLRAHERSAPCFLVTANRLILPAFSDDAAGLRLSRERQFAGHECFAIMDGHLLQVGDDRHAGLATPLSVPYDAFEVGEPNPAVRV